MLESNKQDTTIPQIATRPGPEHRDHGPHRRRQDHDDRAHPVLHRQDPQDRRGPRGRGHDGLDGPGAGARHHDHVGRDDRVLEGPPHQHHRHARPRGLHRRGGALACACSTARSRVFYAVAGVEPQSETVWRQADKYDVPRIAFINKMDRVGADFYAARAVDGRPPRRAARCRSRSRSAPRTQFERHHRSGRDARRSSTTDDLGTSARTGEIPAELAEQAETYRHDAVEAVAEHDEEHRDGVPRGRGARRRATCSAALRAGDARPSRSRRSCAARRSRTRASSRCSTRSSTTCRRRSTCRRSRASTRRPSTRSTRPPSATSRSRRSPSRS